VKRLGKWDDQGVVLKKSLTLWELDADRGKKLVVSRSKPTHGTQANKFGKKKKSGGGQSKICEREAKRRERFLRENLRK